jgi:hypothetical protein
VLLSTFRNVDDLRLTLNGKLVAVDAQKRVYVKNKEFLLEDLARLHKRAAQSERRGKKVPVSILDQMAQIEKNIQAFKITNFRASYQASRHCFSFSQLNKPKVFAAFNSAILT